jgi:hypothetical protein
MNLIKKNYFSRQRKSQWICSFNCPILKGCITQIWFSKTTNIMRYIRNINTIRIFIYSQISHIFKWETVIITIPSFQMPMPSKTYLMLHIFCYLLILHIKLVESFGINLNRYAISWERAIWAWFVICLNSIYETSEVVSPLWRDSRWGNASIIKYLITSFLYNKVNRLEHNIKYY